jgi:hypothetical protein
VAGALVLLYGQVPSRIVELSVDQVTTTDTDTYFAIREQPVLLPPPLATLTTQLAVQNRQREQELPAAPPLHGAISVVRSASAARCLLPVNSQRTPLSSMQVTALFVICRRQ